MYTSDSKIKMANGVEIPVFGLGVWQVEGENAMLTACKAAFGSGYRHIDTASGYNNEDTVGRALAEYAERKDIFITTKLWNVDHLNAEASFEKSLKNLRTDYVDLYLIHWPAPIYNNYVAAWKSLVKIYESGKARAIGVSNFNVEHIKEIVDATGFVPHMNQVERHPFYQQKELAESCFGHGIKMTAYSPLGSGRLALLSEAVAPIAAKHKKTVAQTVLRWHLQTGWVLIPKSVTPSRIAENADIFDFELDEVDMAAIAALDRGEKFLPYPEKATF